MALRFVRVWLVSLLTLGGIVGGTTALAVESDVNLQIVAFDIRDNDTIDIGFEIENRSSATTDLLYRLEVVAKDITATRGAMDATEYAPVRVEPHATKRERFSYTAPIYVGGEVELFLAVTNTDGFPIAGSQVGSVSFTGTSIPATLSSCRPIDEGRAGVTVLPGASPLVTCTLKNTSGKNVVMFLSGDLSLWGVAQDRQTASTKVTLSPGKETLVTLTFPPLSQAGRYEGRAYLGTEVSHLSPVEGFQIIVSGESAHIVHITLDKDVYQAGETAKVTAIVSLEPGSESKRPTVKASLQDGKGTSCATPVERTVENGFEEIELSVEKQCPDPKAIVVIVAASGSVLDTEALAITGTGGEGTWSGLPTGKALGALIIGILCLVGLTAYLVIRQRRASVPRGPVAGMFLFAGLIVLEGFLSADIVSASTLTGGTGMPTDNFQVNGTGTGIVFYTGNTNVWNGQITITGPMRVNGAVAMPTDNFSIIGSGNQINFYTGNSSNFAGSLMVSGGTVSGSIGCNTDAWSTIGSGNQWVISCSGPGGSITFTDTPPPVCVEPTGPYNTAWCQARGYDQATTTCTPGCICTAPRVWNGTACALPVAAVNGACGSSSAYSGMPYTSNRMPIVGLCNSGTFSGPVPPAPPLTTRWEPIWSGWAQAWTWQCLGSGGGSTASCYVYERAGPPAPTDCASPGNVTWAPGCGAPLRALFHGEDIMVTNTVAGYAGWNHFTCNNGTLTSSNASCLPVATVANGACGSSSAYPGMPYTRASMPTSGLCNSGLFYGPGAGELPITMQWEPIWSGWAQAWTWQCRGSGGGSTASCYVYSSGSGGDPSPVTTFTGTYVVAPAQINQPTLNLPAGGGNILLNWNVINAAGGSCRGYSTTNIVGWSTGGTVKGISGNNVPVNIAATTRFDLDCANASGNPAPRRSVQVNVAPAYTYAYCPASLTLNVGDTRQLSLWRRLVGPPVTCTDTTGAIDIAASATTNWNSTTPGSATVGMASAPYPDPKGLVRAVAGGSTSISATDNGVTTGLSVPVTVNLPPPPDYRLCPISTAVGVGGTTQVRAYHIASGSINCSNTIGATEVTGSVNWSSSNSGIATVDNGASKGQVSGISAGNASISASSYLGLTAAPITITVTCAPAWNCDTYAGRQANACPDETWTVVDSCGGTRSCSGTRSCDFNWKEVQQQQ